MDPSRRHHRPAAGVPPRLPSCSSEKESATLQLVAFVLFSIPIAWVSRTSLRVPGSHGFYRFFAWELLVGLVLLNLGVWFDDPFSWHQVISWILLFVCFVPLVLGVRSLRSEGRPVARRADDATLLAFEKTSSLITSGVYHYIRHPLYSSLLIVTWGVFFKDPSWPGGLLAVGATLALVATAKADEAECRRFFGPEYVEYMRTTRMFVPFVF